MKINRLNRSLAIAVLAALSLPATMAFAAVPSETLAKSDFQAKAIAWAPQFAYRSASLRITGPGGLVFDREFGAGKPVFDLSSVPFVADGQYSFELVFGRQPGEALEKAMARSEVGEDGSVADAALAAKLSALRETVSGAFTVSQGQILSPSLMEAALNKDIVHADDVIAQFSLCVGVDCINGENFGADTIRMKENNLRIHFDDTSNSGSFPSNDWRIVANDQANGGASYLAFEDATAGRLVFQVRAGAPSNSIFVDSGGRVGFRTSTPAVDLHTRNGNTPTLRLEQDGSSGFTAQTWDIAGNEANFFIRDVTGGSKLPFKIRPGAPTGAIDTSSKGVGIGGTPSNWGGVVPWALQVKQGAISTNTNGTSTYISSNAYFDGAAWKTINAGNASLWTLEGSQALFYGGVGGAANADIAFSPRLWINEDGNVGIGTVSPSNSHKLYVVGNAKIEGTLQVTGTIMNPDYVFEPGFKLASIEENAAYMWKHRHLPAVGPARATNDGLGVIDVYRQSHGMLEELEKAHIYIEKLHLEISALKAEVASRDAAIQTELAALRKRLEK